MHLWITVEYVHTQNVVVCHFNKKGYHSGAIDSTDGYVQNMF